MEKITYIDNLKRMSKFTKNELEIRNIKKQEFAKKCNLGESTLYRFLDNPAQGTQFSTLCFIAQGLDMSLELFLKKSGVIPINGDCSLSEKDSEIFMEAIKPYINESCNFERLNSLDKYDIANLLAAVASTILIKYKE